MNFLKCSVIFCSFCFSFFAACESASAFGQITEPIILKDLLRGQVFTSSLKLLNTGANAETFEIITEGEIGTWTSLYDKSDLSKAINRITIAPQSFQDVIVKFQIPTDAPNGEYKGVIAVITMPAEQKPGENESVMTVRQRIDREVSLTVSDKEIVSIDAFVGAISQSIKNGDPLQIKATYFNNGNISVKPSIQLKIEKSDSPVFNAIFPYPDNSEAVKAGERKEMPLIEWQTAGQSEGIYQASAKVMIGDNVVKEEKFRFDILSSQAMAARVAGISGASIFKTDKMVWYVLAALAAAAVILAAIKKFGRKTAVVK